MNPLRELFVIMRLAALYRRERPDIVHHVALKPVLYGAIAARVANVKGVVNAFDRFAPRSDLSSNCTVCWLRGCAPPRGSPSLRFTRWWSSCG